MANENVKNGEKIIIQRYFLLYVFAINAMLNLSIINKTIMKNRIVKYLTTVYLQFVVIYYHVFSLLKLKVCRHMLSRVMVLVRA